MNALVAATASALALAAYARVEWPWVIFGWIGLVPWLAQLDHARSLRAALTAGLLMCVAFVVVVFYWLPTAIQAYTGAPGPIALLIVVLTAPLIEPQFLVVAVARYLATRRENAAVVSWRVMLITACAYVGSEWASPKLFADTLGHGLYASVLLRQAADLAGAHGLTFVLVLANECVYAALRSWNRGGGERVARAGACLIAVVTLVAALLVYGRLRLKEFSADARANDVVTAGLVQADITHYNQLATEMGTFDAVRMILDAHLALSNEALRRSDLDVLVWPETVYPTAFGAPKSDEGAAFDREIGGFVTATATPLIFGAYDTDGVDEFNAAFFLRPAVAGAPVSIEAYRKATLFPFTERVPAVIESSLMRRWLPWLGTWKPGTGAQVVTLSLRGGRSLPIAPLICYDAIIPDHALAAVRRGAELIVTLSNDSWFDYGGVPRLILILSAFRSIETRRPQLRATNTGVSAIISATGELISTIGVDQRAFLVGTVRPEAHATTLMLAWGDWFGPVALVCGLGLLIGPWIALGCRRATQGASA